MYQLQRPAYMKNKFCIKINVSKNDKNRYDPYSLFDLATKESIGRVMVGEP